MESSFVGTGRLDSPQTPPVFDMQPSSTGDNTARYGAHTMEQLNNGPAVATSFSYGTARPLTSAAEVTPRISSTGKCRINGNLKKYLRDINLGMR